MKRKTALARSGTLLILFFSITTIAFSQTTFKVSGKVSDETGKPVEGATVQVKGTTIEHFIISHKIERAKELLIYNELTLTEIAEKLHYSNVAHLSNQFKKVTGLTPSFFKKMKHKRLIALENL